jgi:hypothetical protein
MARIVWRSAELTKYTLAKILAIHGPMPLLSRQAMDEIVLPDTRPPLARRFSQTIADPVTEKTHIGQPRIHTRDQPPQGRGLGAA